jgi:integrase
MSKRPYIYETLPNTPGIYKHPKTGHYLARKKIKGKSYSASFKSLRDAKFWKNTYGGEKKKSTQTTSTLGEVWSAMQRLHFPKLSPSTRNVWQRRFKLWEDLAHLKMHEITPTVINEWIEKWVFYFRSDEWQALGSGKHARCSLNMELNLFSTIFNWYKNEDEFLDEAKGLLNPIRPRHKIMGFIKDVNRNHKKIPLEDAFKFFSALRPLYRDLAMTQFYCAGRIGEIAGIQIKNIDLNARRLLIRETCLWCNMSKTFIELNPFPKNKEPRYVYITDELKAIIQRRLDQRWPGSDFLFHVEGKPLNYGTIQVNYREGQRKSGITYTGTHNLRHGMATLARQVGGSLDAVLAMTGHKDLKLADHYSKIDEYIQKQTATKIMDHINQTMGNCIENSQNENVVQFPKRRIQ